VNQSSDGCSSRGPRLSSSSGCELEGLGLPQIPEINIENFFERLGDVSLPEEVYAMFDGVLLPQIVKARRLKWSCNETWLLELDGHLPLCPDSTARSRDARRAMVQIGWVRSCTTSQSSGLTQHHLLRKSFASRLNWPARLTYMAPARSAVVAHSNANCHLWCLVLCHQALLMMTF